MGATRNSPPIHGRWRIVKTDLWGSESLDMLVTAHITFGDHGLGTMQLIAIGAGIDYRVGVRDGHPSVEFSWFGEDDADPACGRGWAVLKGDTLEGQLFIHQGDESGFVAERE